MNEKHTSRKPLKASEPEMRPEYDFSDGVRGKYYEQYIDGSNVVVLDPDVAMRFKNSAAVNKVLRAHLKAPKRGLGTGSTTAARKRAAR